MKIVRQPYHASIVPQEVPVLHSNALWRCVIRREGSPDVLINHEARKKEDAASFALLALVRLQSGARNARRP
jgi:hypothetical protein